MQFGERLRKVVDAYNSRDNLTFTSEVVSDLIDSLSGQLVKILDD